MIDKFKKKSFISLFAHFHFEFYSFSDVKNNFSFYYCYYYYDYMANSCDDSHFFLSRSLTHSLYFTIFVSLKVRNDYLVIGFQKKKRILSSFQLTERKKMNKKKENHFNTPNTKRCKNQRWRPKKWQFDMLKTWYLNNGFCWFEIQLFLYIHTYTRIGDVHPHLPMTNIWIVSKNIEWINGIDFLPFSFFFHHFYIFHLMILMNKKNRK